jgi:hypothetical protein
VLDEDRGCVAEVCGRVVTDDVLAGESLATFSVSAELAGVCAAHL